MEKYIFKIKATIPKTNKELEIHLQGKNLIITGGNGCGKTMFLKLLHTTINEHLSSEKREMFLSLERKLDFKKSYPLIVVENQGFTRSLEDEMDALFKTQNIELTWGNYGDTAKKANNKTFFIRFLEATRQYSKTRNPGMTLEVFNNQPGFNEFNSDDSVNFETYLVALFEAAYIAYALRGDVVKKTKIDSWIESITLALRFLFEDDSVEMEYKENEREFYISQDGKDGYTLSNLSSGYSSVLKIYTELLMKSEILNISQDNLSGIVIIDEIDAHLHISLQKKILSFLDSSYPNIQFIVSTHSPFIIQSVDNAVIYDLSKLEQLEDLSLYSYESIIKGLLGVKTNSDNLNEIVDELASITPRIELHRARAKILMDKLSSSEGYLDSKAKVALLMAKQAIEDLGA